MAKELRKVHDILSESGVGPGGVKMQRRPVAFIQHGNKEDGYTYESVCPWCGQTIAYIPENVARETIGGLYRILLKMQQGHWPNCSASAIAGPKEFAVEITKTPLNVEKAIGPDGEPITSAGRVH